VLPGLQNLINSCTTYAETWRFNFNIKKSKCIIVGDYKFVNDPVWLLNGGKMDNVNELNILGTIFTADMGDVHVDQRIKKCRGACYTFTQVGVCYPCLASNVKAYTSGEGFILLQLRFLIRTNLAHIYSIMVQYC
jgi:hypothetical protein